MNSENQAGSRLRRLLNTRRWDFAFGLLAIVAGVIGSVLVGLPFPVGVVLAGFVIAIAVATMTLFSKRPDGGEPLGLGSVFAHFLGATIIAFGLIQLIPYGREHSNPPVTGEPEWATPRTRELMVRACYGCHSNEVEWPSYSNVAPISWAVTRHVDEGRSKVNYSEFDRPQKDADETIEVTKDGEMPPGYYTQFGLHSEANLSAAELSELLEGLRATPGMSE